MYRASAGLMPYLFDLRFIYEIIFPYSEVFETGAGVWPYLVSLVSASCESGIEVDPADGDGAVADILQKGSIFLGDVGIPVFESYPKLWALVQFNRYSAKAGQSLNSGLSEQLESP